MSDPLKPSPDGTTWEQAEAFYRDYVGGPGEIAHRAIVSALRPEAAAPQLDVLKLQRLADKDHEFNDSVLELQNELIEWRRRAVELGDEMTERDPMIEAARDVVRATWMLSDQRPFLPNTDAGQLLGAALDRLEDALRYPKRVAGAPLPESAPESQTGDVVFPKERTP